MKVTKRDQMVEGVANWIVNTFATPEYARMFKAINVLGMRELERFIKSKD